MRDLWPANPLERLELAAALLGQVHPRLGAWLGTGVESHLMTGEALECCLAVSRERGMHSPRYELLTRRRNVLLRLAASEIPSGKTLKQELAAYAALPAAQRQRTAPQAAWSRLRTLIHEAARLGVGLPQSDDQLRRIMREPHPVAFRCGERSDTMAATHEESTRLTSSTNGAAT
jgi:hypothetical protein